MQKWIKWIIIIVAIWFVWQLWHQNSIAVSAGGSVG